MHQVDIFRQFLKADGLSLAIHFPDFKAFVVDLPQNNSLHLTSV